MLFNFNNPIPEALKDKLKLRELIKKYNIIPYYGEAESTSHTILKIIKDAAALSPSHVACKKDIKFYSFGDNVVIDRAAVLGVTPDSTAKDITPAEQLAYKAKLTEVGLHLTTFTEATRQLYDSYADSGNWYLHIRVVVLNGSSKVYLKPVHYTKAAYLATGRREAAKIIVTEYWSEDWWKKKKPQIYKASYLDKGFNWSKSRDGITYNTILHGRNIIDDSPYYGRSEITTALYWMYVEHALANLCVKIAGTEYVSAKIMAFEEKPPTRSRKAKANSNKADTSSGGPKITTDKSAFQQMMHELRQSMTNEGDIGVAKALAGIKYPNGTNAPTIIDLATNRDTEFNTFLLNTSSGLIYSLNGWDRQLTNVVPVKTNIGGNVLIDLFTIKNVSTIIPTQIYWQGVWATVLNEIAALTNVDLGGHTVKFPNRVDDLLQKLKEVTAVKDVLDGKGDGSIEGEVPVKENNGNKSSNAKDGDGDGKINE